MAHDPHQDLPPVHTFGELVGELRLLLRFGPGRVLRRPPFTARPDPRRAGGDAAHGLRVVVEAARLFLWPSSARRRMACRYRRYARRVLKRAGLPDRGPLYRRLAAHQVRVAAHDVASLRLGLSGGTGVALCFLAAALLSGSTRGAASAVLPYRWASVATVVAIMAVVARLVVTPTSRRARLVPVALATLAAWGVFAAAVSLRGPALVVIVAGSAAVTLVPATCFLLGLELVAAGFAARRERALATAEPDAAATDALLRLLDRSRSGWRRPATRALMLADLERLARAVDGGFARRMRSGDRPTAAWVRDRATGAGAAVRQLKRWVISPLADTRERLRGRLAADLLALVEGRWDALERAGGEPEAPTRRPQWAVAASVARTGVVAVAPGAALWACRRFDPAVASGLPARAAGGCVLWAVTVLVLAVDPALPDRTRAVRGVLDTLAGRGKA